MKGGKSWRRTFSVWAVLIFFLQPAIGLAAADGGVFGKSQTVFQVEEGSQDAVIHYVNGVQRMFISVTFDWQESETMAWIFPLPSDPEDIGVDIVDGSPEFSGSDFVEDAKDSVAAAASLFTFIYAASIGVPWPLTYSLTRMTGLIGTGHGGYSVLKRLEMGGLVVEVVSATEGEGIYNYLAGNGLEISEGVIPQLDAYVQDGFSFVVTWVEETGITLKEPGIIVRFPTDRMYYPLILTSIYGSHVVPMRVLVIGHVSPRIYDGIGPYTELTYYWRASTYAALSDEYSYALQSFVRSITESWNREFTIIELSAPSSALTEDLWIDEAEPEQVARAAYVQGLFETHGILTFLLLFAVVSPAIGLVVGVAVLGRSRDMAPYYFLYGMSNIVGILGLILGARAMQQHLGIPPEKLAVFIIAFSFAFYGTIMAIMGSFYLFAS